MQVLNKTYNAIAVQCSVVRCCVVQCGVVRCCVVLCSVVQCRPFFMVCLGFSLSRWLLESHSRHHADGRWEAEHRLSRLFLDSCLHRAFLGTLLNAICQCSSALPSCQRDWHCPFFWVALAYGSGNRRQGGQTLPLDQDWVRLKLIHILTELDSPEGPPYPVPAHPLGTRKSIKF